MHQMFQLVHRSWSRQLVTASTTTNLLLERLYYAEGRHNPLHPRHGSFVDLDTHNKG